MVAEKRGIVNFLLRPQIVGRLLVVSVCGSYLYDFFELFHRSFIGEY